MPDDPQQRVTCPSCGKGYRWQDKLAGRVVPCKHCGDRFTVPDAPGEGLPFEPVDDEGTYELDMDERAETPTAAAPAVGGKCPQCNAPVKDNAVICMNCGFNMQQGTMMQTAVAAPEQSSSEANLRPAEQEILRKHARAEFLYPGIALALGTAIMLLNAFVVAGFNPRFTPNASVAGIVSSTIGYTMLVAIAALFGLSFAMMLLLSFYGSAFGDLRTALFKLPATSLLVSATAICFIMLYENWLASEGITASGRGDVRVKGVIAFIAAYLTCFPASRLLFDLDNTEANALTIGSLVGVAAGVLLGAAMLF